MRHLGSCRGCVRSIASAAFGNNTPGKHGLMQRQRGVTNSPTIRGLLVSAAGAPATATAGLDRARATRFQIPSRSNSGGGSSSPFPANARRTPVEPGVVSPARLVPDHIPKTPYYATGAVPPQDNNVSRLNERASSPCSHHVTSQLSSCALGVAVCIRFEFAGHHKRGVVVQQFTGKMDILTFDHGCTTGKCQKRTTRACLPRRIHDVFVTCPKSQGKSDGRHGFLCFEQNSGDIAWST